MRYVGADDLSIYLKCRHCKKVHPYETASLENRRKNVIFVEHSIR